MPDLAELNLVIKTADIAAANKLLADLKKAGVDVEGAFAKLNSTQAANGKGIGTLTGLYGAYAGVIAQVTAVVAGLAGAYKAVSEFAEEDRITRGIAILTGGMQQAKQFIDQIDAIGDGAFGKRQMDAAARSALALGASQEDVVTTMKAAAEVAATLGGGAEQVDHITRSLIMLKEDAQRASRGLQQLKADGINGYEAVAEKLGMTTTLAMAKITKGAIDTQTIYDAVIDHINSRNKGAIDLQNKGLAGAMDRVANLSVQALGQVGRILADLFHLPQGANDLANWLENRLIPGLKAFAGFLEGTAPATAAFQALLNNIGEAFKALVLVLEAYLALKLIDYTKEFAVWILNAAKGFVTMEASAAPLLVAVVGIGAALAGWTLSTTLYDNLKDFRLAIEEIRHALAAVSGMTVRDFANKFGIGTPAPVAPGAPISEDDLHDQLVAKIKAGPEQIGNGTGNFGEDFKRNITTSVDGLFSALNDKIGGALGIQNLFKALNKTIEDGTSDLKAQNNVQKIADEDKKNTITDYIANLHKQQEYYDMGTAAVKNQQEIEKLGQANDVAKLKNKAELLDMLKAELELNDRLKAVAEINKDIAKEQRQNELLPLAGRELDIENEQRKLLNKSKDAGIELDATQLRYIKDTSTALVDQRRAWAQVDTVAKGVADGITTGLSDAITQAKDLKTVLLDVVKTVEAAFVKAFVTQPLNEGITGWVKSLAGAIGGGALAGGGESFNGGQSSGGDFGGGAGAATPHAMGDIFTGATSIGGGAARHVAGEGGSPEGLLPLGRDAYGRLGVRGGGSTTINFNVTTPNADSFRQSSRQLSAMARQQIGG